MFGSVLCLYSSCVKAANSRISYFVDLAYRFGVSRTHVTDLLNSAIPCTAKRLMFLVRWPAKEEITRYMPQVIKYLYKRCRVIIDCCEIFIERPGNLTARALTWSSYKSH